MKRDVRILLLGEGKAGARRGWPPGWPGTRGVPLGTGRVSSAGSPGGAAGPARGPAGREPGPPGSSALRPPLPARGPSLQVASVGKALPAGSFQQPRTPSAGKPGCPAAPASSAPGPPAGQGHRRPFRPRAEPLRAPRVCVTPAAGSGRDSHLWLPPARVPLGLCPDGVNVLRFFPSPGGEDIADHGSGGRGVPRRGEREQGTLGPSLGVPSSTL